MKKLLQLSIIILPVSFFLIFFILLTEENQFPGADYREFDLPVFELKILNNDVSIANSDLEGDYVMNVWASWCITCRIEHPYLASLAKNGIPIIGINYKDEKIDALEWLSKYGNPYQVTSSGL
ncbi:MAG: redoxin family protein [Gammaproteobacteria bacterium]